MREDDQFEGCILHPAVGEGHEHMSSLETSKKILLVASASQGPVIRLERSLDRFSDRKRSIVPSPMISRARY